MLDSSVSIEFTGRISAYCVGLAWTRLSGKPKKGYHNQRNWADDIHLIYLSLKLMKPVLVGWSYGGKVVLDYLRVYGEKNIAGINLVDTGTSSSISGGTFYTPTAQAIIPGLKSKNAHESLNTLKKFVKLLFNREPTVEDSSSYWDITPLFRHMFVKQLSRDLFHTITYYQQLRCLFFLLTVLMIKFFIRHNLLLTLRSLKIPFLLSINRSDIPHFGKILQGLIGNSLLL
jgi:pimeloyl-ACP methyl ester carboxylesterase